MRVSMTRVSDSEDAGAGQDLAVRVSRLVIGCQESFTDLGLTTRTL